MFAVAQARPDRPAAARRYHDRRPPGQRREPTLDEPLNPTRSAGGPPPRSETGSVPPPPQAPGLFEQVGSTKDSVKDLVGAHIELAKAEFGEILAAFKRASAYVGVAIGALVVAGLLVIVGLPLFLGEAIFGSMGWGILLGLLLLSAVAIAAAIHGLRPATHASVGRALVLAAILGIVVAVVLGLDLTNRAWSALADAVIPTADPAWRPLAIAVAALAIVAAVLGLIAGAMSGAGLGGMIGGLVGGALGGVVLAFLSAFAAGPRIGAALGVAIGLIAWIALMAAQVVRGGFDTEAAKRLFMPDRTIETAKETIEWARNRVPGSTPRTPGS